MFGLPDFRYFIYNKCKYPNIQLFLKIQVAFLQRCFVKVFLFVYLSIYLFVYRIHPPLKFFISQLASQCLSWPSPLPELS